MEKLERDFENILLRMLIFQIWKLPHVTQLITKWRLLNLNPDHDNTKFSLTLSLPLTYIMIFY